MDAKRFDSLTRVLARQGNRRNLIAGGLGLVAASVAVQAVAQEGTPAATESSAEATACPVMSADDMKAAAQGLIDGKNERNAEGVAAFLHDNYVHHWAIGDDAAGKDDYLASLRNFYEVFVDLHMTVDQMFAGEDTVTVIWTATATQTKAFAGFPLSDKPATWSGIFVFRFECGKIAETWAEADHLGRLRQHGLLPSRGEATPTS